MRLTEKSGALGFGLAMNEAAAAPRSPVSVDVPEYLSRLVAYLQEEEASLWKLFAQPQTLGNMADATRLELLKHTVRLSRDSQPELYAAADHAAACLGISKPLHLYQGAEGGGCNAALFFVPEELHVVLWGPIQERLQPEEQRALMGHELAHHLLWTLDNGAYWIADRLLDANCREADADPAQELAAHRFQFYTELYADRGAVLASDSVDTAIRLLLKTKTGLSDPDVSAYRDQVEDVFAKGVVAKDGGTHPEEFVRVKSMDLWKAGQAEEIASILEGPLSTQHLDVMQQQELDHLTRSFLKLPMQYAWMQGEAMLGQARLIDPNLKLELSDSAAEGLREEIRERVPELEDYWCYLLLDLALAERDLEEAGLLAALLEAEALGIRERLEELARNVTKITLKKLSELWGNREELAEKFAQEAKEGVEEAGL